MLLGVPHKIRKNQKKGRMDYGMVVRGSGDLLGDVGAAVFLIFVIEHRIEDRKQKRRSAETKSTLKVIATRQKDWAGRCLKIADAIRQLNHPGRDYGLGSLITNYENWEFEKGGSLKIKAHDLFSELEKWEEYRNNGGTPDRINPTDVDQMLIGVETLSGGLIEECNK
jgi:hypothetical protein